MCGCVDVQHLGTSRGQRVRRQMAGRSSRKHRPVPGCLQARDLLGQARDLLGRARGLLGQARDLLGQALVLLGQALVLLGQARLLLGRARLLLGRARGLGQARVLLGQARDLLGLFRQVALHDRQPEPPGTIIQSVAKLSTCFGTCVGTCVGTPRHSRGTPEALPNLHEPDADLLDPHLLHPQVLNGNKTLAASHPASHDAREHGMCRREAAAVERLTGGRVRPVAAVQTGPRRPYHGSAACVCFIGRGMHRVRSESSFTPYWPYAPHCPPFSLFSSFPSFPSFPLHARMMNSLQ